MDIQWAKKDSDIILAPHEMQNVKKNRRRLITKNYFQSSKFKERMSRKKALRSKEIQALDQVNMNLLDRMLNPDVPLADKPPKKEADPNPVTQKRLNEPHSMLILEKLPDVNTQVLNNLFSSYDGFKEIRHIVSKKIALIDFEDSARASMALEGLEDHVFESGDPIHINFAKK